MKSLFGLAFLITIIDQSTKWLISQNFFLGDSLSVIPHFFHLTLVYNTGGAFGLFAHKTYLFIALSLVTILFLIFFYRHYSQTLPKIMWPIGFILGGALGNLMDRIRLGYVIDFLDVFIRQWHWPAFNVADSFICIGLGLLALMMRKIE